MSAAPISRVGTRRMPRTMAGCPPHVKRRAASARFRVVADLVATRRRAATSPATSRTVSSIQQHRLALVAPARFVGSRKRVQIGGRRGGIVDPRAELVAAVDEIDGEVVALVLVGEIAPQVVVGS